MILTELQLAGAIFSLFGASMYLHGKVEIESGVGTGHVPGRKFHFIKSSKVSVQGRSVKMIGAALSMIGFYIFLAVPGGEVVLTF